MQRIVALLNIEHFRKRLAEETDEARRQMLQKLLAEEETKLAKMTDHPSPDQMRKRQG
ncbi:MAG TPA: hypothetical protein VNL39_15190 [Xanthobacteraceae bacterium]|nr:hypothetical protein [Xanthobacteraceae bacterium]